MRKPTLLIVALTLLLAACGGNGGGGAGDGLSGRIEADGSSTVGPFVTVAAELFQQENSGVQITVGISGTGGGFERFCAGETDLSTASRPIKDEEREACEAKGVEFTEFQVANDALTVVANTGADWVDCLTVDELKKIWEPGSKVSNWSQVDPSYPDVPLKLFGPGTDSGTFDYFTDAVVGEEGASRSDYAASEDDNVVVTGVSGERGGLGYFGLSYYEQNSDKLKALEIDGGEGCVSPSVETAQSGDYAPLSRPLFVYAKNAAFQRPEVEAFVRFMLENSATVAEPAQFVALTSEQQATEIGELEAAAGS